MKKHSNLRRCLSMVLALVMLLAVVPTAAITVGAVDEGTATVSVTEQNYTQGAVFEIKNIADWRVIAEAGKTKDFAGMTVKLAENISATGIDLPMIAATFKGTFDGNDKIVSGAIINHALIGNILDGATIKALTVSGVKLQNPSNFVGIIGGQAKNNAVTVSGLNVTDCTVISSNQTASAVIAFCSVAVTMSDSSIDADCTVMDQSGIAFGVCQQNLTLTDVTVSGTLTTATTTANKTGVGAVLGRGASSFTGNFTRVRVTNVDFTANKSGSYVFGQISPFIGKMDAVPGTLTVRNCSLENTSVTAANSSYLGGLVGVWETKAGASNKDTFIDVDGFTVSNTVLKGENHVGGLIGALSGRSDAKSTKVTFKNISVNADIDSTCTVTNNAISSGAGGLIGNYMQTDLDAEMLIENVKLAGTLDVANGAAGALVGISSVASQIGKVTIRNCESTMAVSVTGNYSNAGAGGLIGIWGNVDVAAGTANTMSISNCVIGGSVSHPNNNSVGGVIGYYGYIDGNCSIENCMLNASFPNNNPTATDAIGAGMVIGRSMRTGMQLTLKNCSTTYVPENTGASWCIISNTADSTAKNKDYTVIVNGIKHKASADVQKYSTQNDVIATISNAEYQAMVVRDETTGYITEIRDHLDGAYEQHSTVVDGKYNIRFITLTHIDGVESYNISVVAKDTNGNVVARFDELPCTPYSELVGYEGVAVYYTAERLGGKNFIAVYLRGVPTTQAYNFEITSSYVTNSGVTVTGDSATASFNEAGECTNSRPVTTVQ